MSWLQLDLKTVYLQLVSRLQHVHCEHPEKGTYFMAAGTFAAEARDLMLAEMVLTSRAGPLFCARLLNDLHVCLYLNYVYRGV